MADTRRIAFAPSAVEDLEAARDWYRDQGVPDTGDRIVRELVARIETLAVHAERGRVVPELDSPVIREIIHGPYRIVYRLDDRVVRVVRVWRGERVLVIPTE